MKPTEIQLTDIEPTNVKHAGTASGASSTRKNLPNRFSCLHVTAIMALVVAVVLLLGWLLWRALPQLTLNSRADTYMTASQIESIRDIGQWEFLSVNAEELVDTTRPGLFTPDHLVRIYYGTLRLGIDLANIDSSCVSTKGDTLVLTVPDVSLLDSAFIDEARTRSFHESGVWSGRDRNALYDRARQKMLNRCLTTQNIESTRQMASTQLLQILHAMGFEQARIEFRQNDNT